MQQKAKFDHECGKKGNQQLFNENGDPKFAIPKVFLNIIEIAKILVMGKGK